MRVSTATALLALASAASYSAALPIAAPSTNDVVARSPEDINAILAALRAHPDIPLGRPLKIARDDLEARDFFSDFVQGFKEGFTGTIKTLGPLAVDLIKREASPEDIDAILAALRAHPDIPLGRPLKIARDDLEARDFLSDFVQGFKEGFTGTIETLGPLAVDLIKRDNFELIARDFFSDFVQGFKEGFTGTIKTLGPLAVDLIKKEDAELLARDFFSDFVQGFKEGFTGTIKTLGPLAVDLIKREASPEDIDAILAALRAHPDIPLGRPLKIARDDLEARDFFSDFVQGFKEGFTGTIKTLGPLAVDLIKKEDSELLARDFFSDFVQGFKEGFTGTIKTLGPLAVDLIKREASPEDIDAILAALRAHPDIPLGRPLKIARDDLEARDFLSDFVQGFKEGFTGTIKTLGPLAVDLIKKEDSELLARDFLSDFVQGFKEGFTGTIETLGPLAVDLIKKEDLEILAREFDSATLNNLD